VASDEQDSGAAETDEAPERDASAAFELRHAQTWLTGCVRSGLAWCFARDDDGDAAAAALDKAAALLSVCAGKSGTSSAATAWSSALTRQSSIRCCHTHLPCADAQRRRGRRLCPRCNTLGGRTWLAHLGFGTAARQTPAQPPRSSAQAQQPAENPRAGSGHWARWPGPCALLAAPRHCSTGGAYRLPPRRALESAVQCFTQCALRAEHARPTARLARRLCRSITRARDPDRRAARCADGS
jgi:hypothetical protein